MEVITTSENRQLENMSDIIFNEDLTIFGIDQLQALSYVGPVAACIGWNGKQTRDALCMANSVEIEGARAGTSLRRILVTLIDCPDKLKRVLNKRNLRYNDVDPRKHTLIEILKAFMDANVSDVDIVSIFGLNIGLDVLCLLGGYKFVRDYE